MAILDDTRREVADLHAFFERWYAAPGDLDLKRVSSVLAPEFVLHSPSGERLGKDRLLRELEAERGAFPELAIYIEDLQACESGDGTVTVQYKELHVEGGECERRACRAVLRCCDKGCNGLEWVSIDERHDC